MKYFYSFLALSFNSILNFLTEAAQYDCTSARTVVPLTTPLVVVRRLTPLLLVFGNCHSLGDGGRRDPTSPSRARGDKDGPCKSASLLIALKTGFNEFPLFKTKLIKGYSYASVILENIFKNICARLIDDFDAEKYCDRNRREPTWQCRKSAVTSLGRYSWLSAVFGIRSSLVLENPPAG